jgi:hypothetical protein
VQLTYNNGLRGRQRTHLGPMPYGGVSGGSTRDAQEAAVASAVIVGVPLLADLSVKVVDPKLPLKRLEESVANASRWRVARGKTALMFVASELHHVAIP